MSHPDMHKASHDAASTAERDGHGRITHVADKAKKELSYAAKHMARDEHGHFVTGEAEGHSAAGGHAQSHPKASAHGNEKAPDMHAIGHDVASTATRDEKGHIVHVTEKAKKEMAEAGHYLATHLPRDEHGRFQSSSS